LITINIDKACEVLKKDELIGLPTETVYGLAGNAYSEIALKKIFILKNRPFYNPLILHIKSVNYLNKVAKNIPEIALKLVEEFWPGPLTLVLEKQNHISDLVTASKDTVAVRVPNHPVALELLNKLDFPIAAPSANPFGSISSTNALHVKNYFGNDLEIILDGGICSEGIESTIIGFENNQPVLYRNGSISVEEIIKITGEISILDNNESNPKAPGMLSRHYAPNTDTYLTSDVNKLLNLFPNKKIGLLLFNNDFNEMNNYKVEVLSKVGNLKEAAHNLYAALHRLDISNLDVIIAERVPDFGLGKSINDRLQRAIKK
jgi:L-threonylcarbamoyladenylate synthase